MEEMERKFKVGDIAAITPKWPSANAGYRGNVVIIREVLPDGRYLCKSKYGTGYSTWKEDELTKQK